MSYTRPVPATIDEALSSLSTYNFAGNSIYKVVTLASGQVVVFERACPSKEWQAR